MPSTAKLILFPVGLRTLIYLVKTLLYNHNYETWLSGDYQKKRSYSDFSIWVHQFRLGSFDEGY